MNRNLIILLGVLVAVGGIYALTSGQRSHVDPTGGFVDLYEGTLSTADVYGIDVHTGTNTDAGFSLVKRGDDWVMTSHHDAPANLNKVRTLLGNIEGAEGEVRSDDADVLGAYSLGEDEAVHLAVKNEAGQPLLNLLVGKRSGRGGFVRRADENQAILASHNFLGDFGIWGEDLGDPTTSSWLDLDTFKVEADSVRSLELVSEDGTIVMAKEFAAADPAPAPEGATPPVPSRPVHEWRVSQPSSFLAKKSVADAVLSSLTTMRARDVVGRDVGNEDYGLGDDAAHAVLTLANGTTHTLWFGRELVDDESQLYFRVEGQELVWALPSYLRNNVFKSVDELKPE